MIKLYNRRARVSKRFLAPDDGGGSGGSQASGQPQGGEGGEGSGGSNEPIKTPFDDLPWDELDDTSRGKFETAKKDYIATLQDRNKLKTDLERTDRAARQFQSETDRLKTELDKTNKTQQQQNQPDPYIEAVSEELKAVGYPDAEVTKLAPVFAGMFKRVGVLQKKEIGNDLKGMGSAVMEQQATAAFEEAQEVDELGIFEYPEVKQSVWDNIKERVKNNLPTTPAIALNLAKMAWADHLVTLRNKGEELQLPARTRSTMRTQQSGTRFDFPGSGGITPTFSQPTNVNAAKTQLDADTRNALASTFATMIGDMNVVPKDLKDDIATIRRGGRRK